MRLHLCQAKWGDPLGDNTLEHNTTYTPATRAPRRHQPLRDSGHTGHRPDKPQRTVTLAAGPTQLNNKRHEGHSTPTHHQQKPPTTTEHPLPTTADLPCRRTHIANTPHRLPLTTYIGQTSRTHQAKPTCWAYPPYDPVVTPQH
jgi:hypothetical protein